MRFALLTVMNLLRKCYDMIAHLTYNLGVAESNYAKHIITHNLPVRAIIT